MKKYKLLKDLPTFKAGQMFVLLAENEKKLCYNKTFDTTIYERPGLYMIDDDGKIDLLAYLQTTLDKFPNILKDWFEEVEGSKVWKPEEDEEYWYTYGNGDFESDAYPDEYDNEYSQSMAKPRVEIGNCFKTKEEAEKAVEKLKALRRLREKGLKTRYWTWNDVDEILVCMGIDDGLNKENLRMNDDLDLLFGEGE